MEFKGVDTINAMADGISINRIRLEFKAYARNSCGQVKQVLIESDWNLKEIESAEVTITISVLIESDWNLKYVQRKKTIMV